MTPLPSGFVAFLFTDLEGSTRFWEQRPDVMPAVYARHDAILREAVAAVDGVVYKVIGDAFQIAFPDAPAALHAAVNAQRALLWEPWPLTPAPRVRMALHICEVAPDAGGDYRSPGLNRLGRLLTAADGGQILASEPFARALGTTSAPGVHLVDRGEHRFRDLSPQRVFQVHAPGLPEAPAQLRGLAAHRDNLPLPPTTFIGRAAEIHAIQAHLGDPAVRVLTLIGPGGIGKTRLSLAAAAAVAADYADGVWFVPLADVTDPALVAPAIARVFGVREGIDQTLLEALTDHLAAREMVLVLDNLEQLPGAGATIAALVAAAPRLTVLATSRSPLAIAGEHLFPVPALRVPRLDRGLNNADIAALAEHDAIRLFADRARLVRPAFAVDATNIAAIAAICARLDGLPLAIELAAARTKLLTPAQLLPRLDARLPMLTGGGRDLPARQQTLRAAIDWSYDLLEPPERILLARLGVFRGGAALDDIAAVCLAEDNRDRFDQLELLARQSLLEVDEAAPMPRVRLLETIREYALERLAASDEGGTTASRHAAHFLALAERAQEPLAGPEQADWLDLLSLEHDNLRAALDWFARANEANHSVQLAGALWQFWWIRGHLTEGRERLRRAIESVDRRHVASAVLARALDGAGALAEAQGDIASAVASHEEALALWREAGDRRGQARTRENLGLIALHDRGDATSAQEHFAAALALYRDDGDRQGIASALRNLGDAALSEERFSEAVDLFAEALPVARQLANTRGIAAILTSLGALAFFQDDPRQAIRYYEESLPLWRQLADVSGTALVLGNLGEALDHAGESARACSLYEESLALARELGDRQGIAFAQSHLARLARHDGKARLALDLYAESLAHCRDLGDDARLAECMEGIAGTLSDLGQIEDAARLFGAARAHRAMTDSPLLAVHAAAHMRDLDAVRDALGDARFAALVENGAGMTAEAALLLGARPHPNRSPDRRERGS
ncbi:MAG: tetratricopeptide repeat protein [Thermomicrobiales bacterium]